MRVELLGVPLDAVTRDEAVSRVEDFLGELRPHLVTTPNPEMLVEARKDQAFLAALRAADLAVPDGFGLLLVSRILGQPLPERVSGADLLVDVCRAAARLQKKVYLLGGGEGVAARAVAALKKVVPGLRAVGAMSGGKVMKDCPEPCIAAETLEEIKAAAPDVLFVAFGHGVQEKWIVANLPRLPSVRLAMGVGGTFDFLAGEVRRAPALFRKLGLEWLWRLILQPRRAGRIWNAVAVFPYLALTSRIHFDRIA